MFDVGRWTFIRMVTDAKERAVPCPNPREPVFMLARPTTSFGAVAHQGWLYVLGGYSGRPHEYTRDHQSSDFYRVNLVQTGSYSL